MSRKTNHPKPNPANQELTHLRATYYKLSFIDRRHFDNTDTLKQPNTAETYKKAIEQIDIKTKIDNASITPLEKEMLNTGVDDYTKLRERYLSATNKEQIRFIILPFAIINADTEVFKLILTTLTDRPEILTFNFLNGYMLRYFIDAMFDEHDEESSQKKAEFSSYLWKRLIEESEKTTVSEADHFRNKIGGDVWISEELEKSEKTIQLYGGLSSLEWSARLGPCPYEEHKTQQPTIAHSIAALREGLLYPNYQFIKDLLSSNPELAELVLSDNDDPEKITVLDVCLLWAVHHGNHALVEWTLEKGANPNDPGKNNSSADFNNTRIRILSDLTNTTDLNFRPPVAQAARAGHQEILALLLKVGAEYGKRLALLNSLENDNPACLNLLIEDGADLTSTYDDGSSLLQHIVNKRNFKQLGIAANWLECHKLVQTGKFSKAYQTYPEKMKGLLKSMEAKGEDIKQFLYKAAENNDTQGVRLLLVNCGLNPMTKKDEEDEDEKTLFDITCDVEENDPKKEIQLIIARWDNARSLLLHYVNDENEETTAEKIRSMLSQPSAPENSSLFEIQNLKITLFPDVLPAVIKAFMAGNIETQDITSEEPLSIDEIQKRLEKLGFEFTEAGELVTEQHAINYPPATTTTTTAALFGSPSTQQENGDASVKLVYSDLGLH